MSDQPLNFKPADAARSVFGRIVTPRTVIYLIAVLSTLIFIRRYEDPAQTRPANTENSAPKLTFEPVTAPATISLPAERLPMLLVFDPGDNDLAALVNTLRQQVAGRCNITRVDVSKNPGALAHFSLSQAPAARLYDHDNHEVARYDGPFADPDAIRQWLAAQLQPPATEP
jgi:hypothetical protein